MQDRIQDRILELIESLDQTNINLAIQLATSQKIDLKTLLDKEYGLFKKYSIPALSNGAFLTDMTVYKRYIGKAIVWHDFLEDISNLGIFRIIHKQGDLKELRIFGCPSEMALKNIFRLVEKYTIKKLDFVKLNYPYDEFRIESLPRVVEHLEIYGFDDVELGCDLGLKKMFINDTSNIVGLSLQTSLKHLAIGTEEIVTSELNNLKNLEIIEGEFTISQIQELDLPSLRFINSTTTERILIPSSYKLQFSSLPKLELLIIPMNISTEIEKYRIISRAKMLTVAGGTWFDLLQERLIETKLE